MDRKKQEESIREKSSINTLLTSSRTPTSKKRAPAESSSSSGSSPRADRPPPKKTLREDARSSAQSPRLEAPRPRHQPPAWLHATYNMQPTHAQSPSPKPLPRQSQVGESEHGGYGSSTQLAPSSLTSSAYGQPPRSAYGQPPAHQQAALAPAPYPHAQARSAPSSQTTGPVSHFTQGPPPGATPAVSFYHPHDPLIDPSYGPRGGLLSAGQRQSRGNRGRRNADDIARRN